MKNLIFGLTATLLMVSVSCSEESKTQDVNLKDLKVDLSKMNINNSLIFEYSTKDELLNNLKIDEILFDFQQEIKNNNNVNEIKFKMCANKGKLYITEILFINLEKKVLVESKLLLNDELISSQNSTKIINIDGTLFGRCPQGWTYGGSCSNIGNNTSTCIGNHISDFFSNRIGSIGDCAQVQVSVRTLTTSVCGKSC